MSDTIGGAKGKQMQKMTFRTHLNWLEKKRGILSAGDVRDTVRVALPAAFGGEGDEWSPEHLFLGSISSCFMTTFLVMAQKMGFTISRWECPAEGEVELIDGKYEFTRVVLYPKVSIAEEAIRSKAMLAMDKAGKYCLVSNSLKTTVVLEGQVVHDPHPMVHLEAAPHEL
jgi:peroxiredoxin-like protein